MAHRSFSLPRRELEEAFRVVPPEEASNPTELVRLALRQLVQRYSRQRFQNDMQRMAADPAVAGESARIAKEFEAAEADGLG